MDQAEQLRNLVKKQTRQEHLARVITVTSGKGGVGKSNISLNLAIQFSRLRKKVVILDADFGLANIEVMLGIRPQYNLSDVIFRGRNVGEIITKGPGNIGFVSGGSGIHELTNLTSGQLKILVNVMYQLDSIADIIIIDTGAGISDNVMEMILSSSEILLVATPEPASITDAYVLLKTLKNQEGYNKNSLKIRLLGNRTQNREEGRELFEKLDSVVGKFLDMEMDYMGAVPYDSFLQKAVMKQRPVSLAYPNAPSSKAIQELASILENKSSRHISASGTGLSGIFAKILRNHNR
ncbi:MAG: MinD/ParA family protein [Lachnospiraceae bacterium]|nr:MinD/ParA family protein [Lachnospiraceae bacterium]